MEQGNSKIDEVNNYNLEDLDVLNELIAELVDLDKLTDDKLTQDQTNNENPIDEFDFEFLENVFLQDNDPFLGQTNLILNKINDLNSNFSRFNSLEI